LRWGEYTGVIARVFAPGGGLQAVHFKSWTQPTQVGLAVVAAISIA